jgi:hypothetical protein
MAGASGGDISTWKMEQAGFKSGVSRGLRVRRLTEVLA